MSAEIAALALIPGSIDLYGKNRSFGCRGKTPGSVAYDAATEGRTVQAAACRAAVYGFDSHPRLHLDGGSGSGGGSNPWTYSVFGPRKNSHADNALSQGQFPEYSYTVSPGLGCQE